MSETTPETPAQPVQEPDGGTEGQVQQMLADAVTAGRFLNREQPQQVPSPDPQPTSQSPVTSTEGETEKDWKAEAEKWRALARKHENQHLSVLGFKSKDEIESLRDAAEKYRQVEEAQKTEIQKATERAQAVEQQLSEMRAQNARLLAAATYNLPPELIERIGGSTEEEISANAEALAAFLDEQRKAAAPQQRPVESLTPGAAPASAAPLSPDEWIRKLAGR
jgi:hypothetical protein